jgi:hypothetical protein
MNRSLWLAIFAILGTISGPLAFTIDCNFRTNNNFYAVVTEAYECLTIITENSSDHTITGINGTHITGMSHNDVTAISIRGQWLLSFIPFGASQFFPNLKVLYITYIDIDTLHGHELDEFTELVNVWIDSSNLTTISSRLFERTRNVVVVDFRQTLLERVGRHLFAPFDVNQLQYMWFNNNRCINREASDLTGIVALIDALHVLCPFDDEPLAAKDQRLNGQEKRITWL